MVSRSCLKLCELTDCSAAMPCAEVTYSPPKLCSIIVLINATPIIGPEHSATASAPGQPSYCTLPMFHPPANPANPPRGLGYISNDGHSFECRNPVVMQQAFHV